MCWLIEVIVKFQLSSLEMKSYKVTIQMKATKQYFPVVLFIMSCSTSSPWWNSISSALRVQLYFFGIISYIFWYTIFIK